VNINATAFADANEMTKTKKERSSKTLDDIKKEQSKTMKFAIETSQAFMGIFLGTMGFVLSLYSALYVLDLMFMISPMFPMILAFSMLITAGIIYFKE
jgi:hypothetical protein